MRALFPLTWSRSSRSSRLAALALPLALGSACQDSEEQSKVEGADEGGGDGAADDGADGGAADGAPADGGAGEGGDGSADGGASDGGASDGGASDGGASDGGADDGDDGWSDLPPGRLAFWGLDVAYELPYEAQGLVAADVGGDSLDELLFYTFDGELVVLQHVPGYWPWEIAQVHSLYDIIEDAYPGGVTVVEPPQVYSIWVGGANNRSVDGADSPVLLDVRVYVSMGGGEPEVRSLSLRLDDLLWGRPTVTVLSEVVDWSLSPCSAVTADVDSDGQNDILIEDPDGLRLWRSGSDTWEELAGPGPLSGGAGMLSAHVMNLDNSGGLDLYLFTYPGDYWWGAGAEGARTFMADGDGFGAATARSPSVTIQKAASWGEGADAELVVLDDANAVWSAGAGRVELTYGHPGTREDLGSFGEIGHFDNSPGLDVLRVPDFDAGEDAVLGNGAGSFRPASVTLSTYFGHEVLLPGVRADLDGDAIDDMVYADTDPETGYTSIVFWIGLESAE